MHFATGVRTIRAFKAQGGDTSREVISVVVYEDLEGSLPTAGCCTRSFYLPERESKGEFVERLDRALDEHFLRRARGEGGGGAGFDYT